ncbi:hypothetical protein PMAC_002089 [Pneumocystis sp. 'macacae']|nr:hypothetical protein PMAC_002089 [Pneumocystis sp. 'macacae']
MLSWWTHKKATSENIPAGTEDLASCLEICDMIRSKSVHVKDAIRSIKRRISHRNPNVQILVLKLIDLCVKNGGDHFLLEISSREFMDYLVSLLKANDTSDQNSIAKTDVRTKILELIQMWVTLFEKKESLGYVYTVYEDLLSQGYNFPPKEVLSSTFIDSFSPPEWCDSNICMLCRVKFTFKNRKHHCRNCGGVFCQSCSSKSCSLLYMGIIEPTRVCDNCYFKKTQGSITSIRSNNTSKTEYTKFTGINNEKDLNRVIEMPLKENKFQDLEFEHEFSENYKNEYSNNNKDLKEAITLSLKDMEISKPKNLNMREKMILPNTQLKSEYELTTSEIDNINTFSILVNRLQTAPLGSIIRDYQVQELYDSITKLKPKLIRSLGNITTKYEKLLDIHSKLSTVMKYYDKLLEDRLPTVYSNYTISPTYKTKFSQTNRQIQHPSLLMPTSLQPLSSEYYSYHKDNQLEKNKSFCNSYISGDITSLDTSIDSKIAYSHKAQENPNLKKNNSTISTSISDLSSENLLKNTFKPTSSAQTRDSYITVQNEYNLLHNNSNQSFYEQIPQDKNDHLKQISLIDL